MSKQPAPSELGDRWDVVIVGGGPAGATAALYAARAGWSAVVVDKGIAAGALGMSSKITNYPGVDGGPGGAEVVERVRAQAVGFGASFVGARVTAAALSEIDRALFAGRETFRGRAVVIATGSMGREPMIPGEQRLIGHGVSYCATCDGFFFQDQDVAVVGNNDEALEEAMHVGRFARRVTVLSPTPTLRSDESLVQQAEQMEPIEIRTSVRVHEIVGDRHVEGIVVGSDVASETIPVSGVFVYLQGGRPILDFLGGQLDTTEDGCLRVDATFQTSLAGVFAAGDVLCKHIKQAVIAAAEGAQAAIAADRYLSGRSSLRPDWS